jgi:hypothetical protein
VHNGIVSKPVGIFTRFVAVVVLEDLYAILNLLELGTELDGIMQGVRCTHIWGIVAKPQMPIALHARFSNFVIRALAEAATSPTKIMGANSAPHVWAPSIFFNGYEAVWAAFDVRRYELLEFAMIIVAIKPTPMFTACGPVRVTFA